ncbi:MAG: chitobiase/beta-hexosaminidase C-terminal domain-containing protein [Saprospiraceae bacterium]|nr:chitobiase/beta-hexosaminidase C-terminal domain-containing protein [Saprospiraceae bacterium]
MIARLHPLLVHLPIGILLLAFGLECLSRWGRRHDLQAAIRLSLAAGVLSALAAAGTGWLLGQHGGYETDLLQRHQWLGLATAGLAVLSWWGQGRSWYFPAFAATIGLLVLAGHYGGSLTHGDRYLFEKEESATEQTTTTLTAPGPETPVFSGLIQPILQQKCYACHNANKHKGELRLDSPEGIVKGGKNGKVIEPGQPKNSPLLSRLHLPATDDKHMPPAGKPQLSDTEIRLLEWWIEQGADMQATLATLPLPAALEAAFQKVDQNPVFANPMEAPEVAAVQRLKSLFVSVQSMGAGSPWLAVSFAGLPHPSADHWKALRTIAAQTIDLDLSHTDAPASVLADCPQVIRLNLAYTPLDDAAGPALGGLRYLETLNLTGTRVTEKIVASLEQLPLLKRLYLWQTAVPPAAMARLQQAHPQLRIEAGAQVADSVQLALRAPKLLFGRTFFEDTLQVRLDYPAFKGVSLYYTTDEAASPTVQSAVYKDRIELRQTGHVRAFAAKEGWLNSPVVDALFVKKQVTPAAASLAAPASPKYPALGATSLIDGKIADAQGADTWLGYEGEHLRATLDMGRTMPVHKVFVHCLENNVAWIFKPASIQVETSLDGKIFRPAAERSLAANTAMGEPKTHLLDCALAQATSARFVRVTVKSLLKNPSWHPSKGQKCWIFVDEMLVE